ncbi:SGNH/GDSL hydrolase family protein [Demequina sp. SO4-13]|uniref:SGNH/GDSL hydrolase family protein n=1 Tax=Demequina sp. SO4-13 TaxID=3401027 RepID=UPI003AF592CA
MHRGYEPPWLKREFGGMPNWGTLVVLAMLGAMVFFVISERAQTSADTGLMPAAEVTPRASAAPSAVQAPEPTRVVAVSDSYTAGSAEDSGAESRWPASIGVEPIATSGVGYVQGGAEGSFVALAGEIPAGATTVVFFGSRNDMSYGYDAVREGADAAFATALSIAPDATMIVIGPPWVDADPPAEILTVRDAVSDAASAVEATWVDPIAEGWFVDDEQLIGSDGVHPTDAGHAFLAERISEILAASRG